MNYVLIFNLDVAELQSCKLLHIFNLFRNLLFVILLKLTKISEIKKYMYKYRANFQFLDYFHLRQHVSR